jgi:Fe-Mn family superoxide dismutase
MTAEIDRRTALAVTLTAGAMLVAQGCATAQQAPAMTTGYQPKPLPFDPKSIPGLSERILVSHHANNYVGAVTRLGAIEAQVAQLDPTAPGFMYNGLKREELLAMNSMILHELYFASLGKAAASRELHLQPRSRRILAASRSGGTSLSRWARRLAAAQAGSC